MNARAGDTRPLERPPGARLTIRPARPFRWLPRHGHPICVCEWATQGFVKALAWAPLYTAVIVTLMLLVILFVGVPSR